MMSKLQRVCDALDNINIVGAMADPHEFPIEWRSIEVATTMIKIQISQ